MPNTDDEWERVARTDPYWAVLSHDEFTLGRMTPDVLERFYASGDAEVADLLGLIRSRLDPGFAPRVAVDFGCGVGRMLRGLAQHSEQAVGVDVSPTMLELARQRLKEFGVTNVELVLSNDRLSEVPFGIDLVHSTIVFQHIPPSRGYDLFEQLVWRLGPGGCGVVHFHTAGGDGWLDRIWRAAVARRPSRSALIRMYEYDPGRLLAILAKAGIHEVLTRTNGAEMNLYFRRP
jgi:SAM-dependent methyltransferase